MLHILALTTVIQQNAIQDYQKRLRVEAQYKRIDTRYEKERQSRMKVSK